MRYTYTVKNKLYTTREAVMRVVCIQRYTTYSVTGHPPVLNNGNIQQHDDALWIANNDCQGEQTTLKVFKLKE